uniref:Uncharacterized protein n=1 Tax=Polysiphonia sp. TaxID=1967842 RepID=A0A1Z1M416_9FLOR|nr:hypothetical protein [Polysiphonia sp.]
MDRNYLMISVFNQETIEAYYLYNCDSSKNLYNYPVCFVVCFTKTNQMFKLLSNFSSIDNFSTEHKMYLGKEIFKAQIAIYLKQIYIQS